MSQKKENIGIIYKRVNEILMTKPIINANYWDLCGQKEDNFETVYRYLLLLLDKTEGKTDNYINKLLTAILSYVIVFNENKYQMKDEDTGKILNFELIYLNYTSSQEKKASKDVVETMEKLKEMVQKNQSLSSNEINEDESIRDLKKQLDNYQGEVLDLRKKIKELENSLKSLETVNSEKEKLQNKFSRLNEKLKKLTEEYHNIIKQLSNAKGVCESITGNVGNLSEQLLLIKKIIVDTKSEIDDLKTDNEKWKTENCNLKKRINRENDRISRCKKIDEYILSLLFRNKKMTLSQLMKQVDDDLLDYTHLEIQQAIGRIPRDYYVTVIDQYDKQFPPVYGIYHPMYTTNGSLTIPCTKDSLDLLITSDWHLATDSDVDKAVEKLKLIYDYCAKQNISHIVNLGDFLDVKDDSLKNQFYMNFHLLERIVKEFPFDDNICHALLMGNHDKKLIFKCGFNLPIYLEENRTDFINLGLDFSKILIPIPGTDMTNIIGLHHPKHGLSITRDSLTGVFDTNRITWLNLNDCSLSNLHGIQYEINAYLNNLYSSRQMNRDDVFMDLLGHMHLSQMYSDDKICLIPSLMRSSNFNTSGFTHLKLWFNSKQEIETAMATSLVDNSKILPVSHTLYKKRNNKY